MLVPPGAIGLAPNALVMMGGISVTVKAPENSEVLRKAVQVPSVHKVVVAVIMSPAAPAKLWGKDSTPEPVWVILTNEA